MNREVLAFDARCEKIKPITIPYGIRRYMKCKIRLITNANNMNVGSEIISL